MLRMKVKVKASSLKVYGTKAEASFNTRILGEHRYTASTRAHLHGVDGRLCCGSSQRSGQKSLMGLDLSGFTGKQLLILTEHSERERCES